LLPALLLSTLLQGVPPASWLALPSLRLAILPTLWLALRLTLLVTLFITGAGSATATL
jgi:hypothetical protein